MAQLITILIILILGHVYFNIEHRLGESLINLMSDDYVNKQVRPMQ